MENEKLEVIPEGVKTVNDKDQRAAKILADFKYASEKKSQWCIEAREDFNFKVGNQHSKEHKTEMRAKGVLPLVINKIQPNIFLVSGIQRQNRTNFTAFPEGEEDSIIGEVTTRLLKNAMKNCDGEHKVSEQFEDCITCGEGWLEPYIDYTHDLLNGKLRFKKVSPFQIFVDPDAIEYDNSDAKFIIKFSESVTEEQLITLFPDKEKQIKTIASGKIDFSTISGISTDARDYAENTSDTSNDGDITKKQYDLIEYYYKKMVKKYIVVDPEVTSDEVPYKICSKEEAEEYQKLHTDSTIIERMIPEVWVDALIGNGTIIDSYQCQFFPKWKSYPIIPNYAHRITIPLEDREYMVQGIVRALKDPQREINKRRIQELRHLGSSTHSGWKVHKTAKVAKDELTKKGGTSGFVLVWEGKIEPKQIHPQPLSAGHHLLAERSTADLKEISGINADLLALNEKTQSGRAIHLRQQQGIVMIQGILDNLSRTKKIIGRFILSQLNEIYTVETAIKVCGQAFIKDNFSKPVMADENTPVMENGEMKMEIDNEAVGTLFQKVLSDPNLGNYDVAVGEGANSETVKYANASLLMDLVEKGAAIPPEIIIEESMLSSATKGKIIQAITAQQGAVK